MIVICHRPLFSFFLILDVLINHTHRRTHAIVVGVQVEHVVTQKYFTIKAHLIAFVDLLYAIFPVVWFSV